MQGFLDSIEALILFELGLIASVEALLRGEEFLDYWP